jgi:hypothetical protein
MNKHLATSFAALAAGLAIAGAAQAGGFERVSHIQVGDGHGGWSEYRRLPRGPSYASGEFGGVRRTAMANGDGAHTLTETDNFGRTSSWTTPKYPRGISIPDGDGGWRRYKPAPRGPSYASGNIDGVNRIVTANPDHTHTITEIDGAGRATVHATPKYPEGISIPDGNGGWKRYTPAPRGPSSVSADIDGVHRTVTANPNGTHTITETDRYGRSTTRTTPVYPQGISVPDGNGGWKPYVRGG